MKGGRPAMREQFRREIINVLADYQYPATTSTVKRLLDLRHGRPCGWDTVEKYLQELVADQLVAREALPAQGLRKPLVVYLNASRLHARQFLGTFSPP
jgi:hypothetical protein